MQGTESFESHPHQYSMSLGVFGFWVHVGPRGLGFFWVLEGFGVQGLGLGGMELRVLWGSLKG